MGELRIRKIIPYGVLVLGIVLCLYSLVMCGLEQYKQQRHIFIQAENIGQIEIPKIAVNLPIYKGTGEEVLQNGIGCMVEGSSLGGAKSTHSILAGHRGLPHADLFKRLDELEIGDCFTLLVADKELAYEVCSIQVIRPSDTKVFSVQEGRNLVSLVTCTPYGINTHRLVVTGERKE